MFATEDDDDVEDPFFTEINRRGGLTVPSENIISIGRHAFNVSTGLFISDPFESLFLQETNDHHGILAKLIALSLSFDDYFSEFKDKQCSSCGKYFIDYIDRVISIFCNCLLNNYRKNRNNDVKSDVRHEVDSKGAKKRKLETVSKNIT